MGTLVALLETWQIMTIAGDRWVTVLLGTIGCAVAMLGPGLRSVDARLFGGWKRVVLLRKISLKLLKSSFINQKIYGLKEAVSFPP